MTVIRKNSLTVLLFAFALMVAGRVAAEGENPSDYLHTRNYFGLLGTSININSKGLFNGTTYSRVDKPSYEITLLPSLAQAFGWGALMGHREETYAVEVSFWQSSHASSFGPGVATFSNGSSVTFTSAYQSTAVYNSINLDLRRYILTDLPIQPFFNLGVSFPWIDLGAADMDVAGTLWTATVGGFGFNLGLGVEYYLSPNLSFTVGVFQRWASFDEFKGSQTQYNQLSSSADPATYDGSGLDLVVGTTFGFE
jgi:hypothetical protein